MINAQESLSQRLERVASQLVSEASIADRPGQTESLERLAGELTAIRDQVAAMQPAKAVPEVLRGKLNYAIAAVRYGVTCEPGNPESATGVTAEEALAEADSFLAAFENWLGVSGGSGASGVTR